MPMPSTARASSARASCASRERPPKVRCATCATPPRKASGFARPGTLRPTRPRPFSTGSSPVGRRGESRRAARTGSCVPCSRSRARRDDGLLPGAPAARAHRRDESRHGARADPGRDPTAAAAPAPGCGRKPRFALGEERARLPRGLEASLVAALLASRAGAESAGPGRRRAGRARVRRLRLEGAVVWGPWTLEAERGDLEVRARRPGDHLAGRRKKVQDLLVDAKVPRAERENWPVVVCAGEVVAVPAAARPLPAGKAWLRREAR